MSYNKTVAILCNGPSRVSYDPNKHYDYRIGCNIPWTDVDATVLLDPEVIKFWDRNHHAVQCKAYISEVCWKVGLKLKSKDLFKERIIRQVRAKPPFHSSGHLAVEQAIAEGYKLIDIYGCDSWFEFDSSSYTHTVISRNIHSNKKVILGWRQRWIDMMKNNPDVTFNFIR